MNTRQTKWDYRWLSIAKEVAGWSKDPSTKVGAVVVNREGFMVATGYNGFPAGHTDDPELYTNREYKYANIIHAEANALRQLRVIPLEGFTLYTSFPCCPDCVLLASRHGVSRLVCLPIDTRGKTPEWIAEWDSRIELSKIRAAKLGIEMEVISV